MLVKRINIPARSKILTLGETYERPGHLDTVIDPVSGYLNYVALQETAISVSFIQFRGNIDRFGHLREKKLQLK